jgi:5-methylcytosine-specific restriction endonuclease McrA
MCAACKTAARQKWSGRAGIDYCTRCAGPRDSDRKSCGACRAAMRVVSNARRSAFIAAGRCVQCGTPRDVANGFYCSTHIFKLAAYRWLDDVHRWADLKLLFEHQGGRCAYTGVPLILSDTASLDHKMPRSRGGLNTLENVQWVTWQVNRCKTDMTHDEFMQMCALVCRRLE